MQFNSIFATMLLATTAIAAAVPEINEHASLISRNHTLSDAEDPDVANFDNTPDVIEDGVPDFDPLELTQDESKVQLDERDLHLEDSQLWTRASPASKVVECARKYKGTKYLYGGCKSASPFGPAKGGMDCSCLSRTCIKKGTGITIRKLSFPKCNY